MNLDVEEYLYRATGIIPTVTVSNMDSKVSVQIGNSKIVSIDRYTIQNIVAHYNSGWAWDVNWMVAQVILNELKAKN